MHDEDTYATDHERPTDTPEDMGACVTQHYVLDGHAPVTQHYVLDEDGQPTLLLVVDRHITKWVWL